jgi:prevent-host-death family protein
LNVVRDCAVLRRGNLVVKMAITVSLREANQSFARCIRDVEAGAEYVITRNGRPVARLLPIGGRRVLNARQEAALARTRERMAIGWPISAGPLDRDALHDRE